MTDFSSRAISEIAVLEMFDNGDIGPYYASWILNKKFKKGYKAISDYLHIYPVTTNDIKDLSKTIYKSGVFTQKAVVFLVKRLDVLNEKIIKKLVAIASSINLVKTVDISETATGFELYMIYKNGVRETIASSKPLISSLPDYDLSLLKYALASRQLITEVLMNMGHSDIVKLKEKFIPIEQEKSVENHVDNILSTFNF